MNRTPWAILGIAVLAGLASAQQVTQPILPAPSYYPTYGSYGGGHASTLEEGAMNGMANMMSARGSYNLQTSQAAINLTQAQSSEIANHQQYTDTYFQVRATNRAARAAENPRPTMDQLVRVARERTPKQLTSNEVDPVSGEVTWPDLLQYPDFAAQRDEITKLLQLKAAHGTLGYADTQKFIQASEQMAMTLKRGVKNVPPQKYIASKNFIKSLLYSTCQVGLE